MVSWSHAFIFSSWRATDNGLENIAVLHNDNVLILDEPTRNFSPLSGPVIRKMLREFPGAIISISHDRKYIGEVCGKEYLLEKDGLRLIREEK